VVKDRRFLSARLLHIIEEGLLNDGAQLVHHWLREAKTNEEIGLILRMKPRPQRNTSPRSLKNSASKTAPPPR